MKTSVSWRQRATAAFSLLEMMIATTILGITMAIFMGVYSDMTVVAFTSEAKSEISRDVRNITNHMTSIAQQASYFVLYNSFRTVDRDSKKDRRYEGKTGDFVVFVYLGAGESGNDAFPVERIAGYFRDADPTDPTAAGPVRTFDIAVPHNDRYEPLESLFPPASTASSQRQVLELSEGLANGDLFFNLWDRSVMINGRILHGNAAKRITDTYNYTVSPRGIQQ